jgi:four helix bundle protein
VAESTRFTLKIYDVTKLFPKEEIYSLTKQIRRAAFSIPANMAEGCGKRTQADFKKFLNISLGSSNEAEYYLILAFDLNYLNKQDFISLSIMINEVRAMLIGLISKVDKT